MQKFMQATIFLVSILAIGCTSSPNLESYPERQIDRPYTLPEGVASWKTSVSARQIDDGRGEVVVSAYPLIWEQALSDKWTLEYSPIPLSARYQISKTENNIWGLRFGTGLGYSSLYGVILQPQLGLYHRARLTDSWAWESTVNYSRVFSSEKNRDEYESARVSTGPMLQVDKTKVILPKIGLAGVRNDLSRFADYENFEGDDDFSFTLPASINFQWLFHRQWEYSLGYSVNSLIHEEDYLSIHSLNTSIKHFW